MVEEVLISNVNKFHFDVFDYAVFAAMLVLSALTGLYYGCRGRYCKTGEVQNLREYLTGNGDMKPFPVAMSLVASYISGVTILGTPAEIYNFGTQYWLIVVAIIVSSAIVAFVYLPVFSKLHVHSSYEYLELRFNKYVRTVASVLFVLDEIMFLPILIYVPSLAFNQVTGIDIHLIGTIVCVVCIFYTVLGGLKAVVWTDTWQIIVMFISVMVVIILGTISYGGVAKVWDTASSRLIFLNFNTSMYERHTVFSVIIGGVFYWTSFNAVNQTMVQRYLSVPSIRKAQTSILIFAIGVSAFVSACCYAGLIIYATYSDCDPLKAGRIHADDQLLPMFVMETAGHLRGIPGLFIAGVFGAALSSLSVILNSTSTVFLEDFVKGCINLKLKEETATIFVKVVAFVLGVVALAFLYVVEHLGGVLAMATSLSAIAAGTTFGVFTLGMLIPWSNSTGAVVGAISGFVLSGWVSFGSQYAGAAGLIIPKRLPVATYGCEESYGIIVNNTTSTVYHDESNVFPLHRLSYHWITPIGVVTVLLVGSLVSLISGKRDLKFMDPDLISPVIHRFLPEESFRYEGYAIRNARHKDQVNCENGFKPKMRVPMLDLKEDSHRSLTCSEER
ncbi:sodium-coupled monocarboxylate transporter 1-like [Onthophagus taurus]|uniref:sodium-coupled monocarboxylate transporter 1-like n=1 Tax=Onthophagus taurus TaxID=166361 RepID=UPI0039BEB032